MKKLLLIFVLTVACAPTTFGPGSPDWRSRMPEQDHLAEIIETTQGALSPVCPTLDPCHYIAGPMPSKCSPDVELVNLGDSWCGQVTWDGICVEEIGTIAGSNVCGWANRNTWMGVKQGIFMIQAGPKDPNSGPTIAAVCAVLPYCCTGAWTDVCRAHAEYFEMQGGPGSISEDGHNPFLDPANTPGRCGDFHCRDSDWESPINCSFDCPGPS